MNVEPRALLTIAEASRALQISNDTIHKQIQSGDLPAISLGKTSQGRTRYRIPQYVIQERLGQTTSSDVSEHIQKLFSSLDPQEQELLLQEAIAEARQCQSTAVVSRKPQPTQQEIQQRFRL